MKPILTTLILGSLFVYSCSTVTQKQESDNYQHAVVATADEALQLLQEGNHRFVNNTPLTDNVGIEKRKDLKENGQKPFAIVLTCSDSRVAPELLFDQGLGDLFIIRVAGNIVDSVGMGSIQYAAEHLNVPLIMVLGHEKCGAVHATVQGGELPGSVPSIARRIQPCVEQVKSNAGTVENIDELVADANVEANVEAILHDEIVHHLVGQGKVKVIGAKYLLETGEVILFEPEEHEHHN